MFSKNLFSHFFKLVFGLLAVIFVLAIPVSSAYFFKKTEILNTKYNQTESKIQSDYATKIDRINLENSPEWTNLTTDVDVSGLAPNNSKKPISEVINSQNSQNSRLDHDHGEEFEEEDGYRSHENYKLRFPDQPIVTPRSEPLNVQPAYEPVLPHNANLVGFLSSSFANGSTNISIKQNFTVTFTSPPTAEVLNQLKFYPDTPFTKKLAGNTLTVTPTRMLRATEYVFGLGGKGLCAGDQCSTNQDIWYYAFRFRTNFKELILSHFTVLNVPVFAHAYGNAKAGGKSILLTGGTHGEEWHAGGLWLLVAFLDANPQEIINQNKEIIIITEVNHDGANRQRATQRFDLAARFNSRGVNLNRNFPSQWIPCSTCGAYGGSEPETRGVMGITALEGVTHTIVYHNQWPPHGVIFLGSDTNPVTRSWSAWVSARTGYPQGVYNGPEVAGGGDVPGDQAVWSESVGVVALLIEGTYRGVDDWGKNFPMYLALLREF